MNMAAKKLLQYTGRVIKDNPDFGNPINVDTVEFALSVGKGLLKITKEVLF